MTGAVRLEPDSSLNYTTFGITNYSSHFSSDGISSHSRFIDQEVSDDVRIDVRNSLGCFSDDSEYWRNASRASVDSESLLRIECNKYSEGNSVLKGKQKGRSCRRHWSQNKDVYLFLIYFQRRPTD